MLVASGLYPFKQMIWSASAQSTWYQEICLRGSSGLFCSASQHTGSGVGHSKPEFGAAIRIEDFISQFGLSIRAIYTRKTAWTLGRWWGVCASGEDSTTKKKSRECALHLDQGAEQTQCRRAGWNGVGTLLRRGSDDDTFPAFYA